MQKQRKKKVFVALSGGVDSAVCAALLQQSGYQVHGIYMKNWSEKLGIDNDCPWEKDVADVKEVCEYLDIPWRVYNFEKEYQERIIGYFFNEYKQGRTPNPDVLCNSQIKFDLFLDKALSEGTDFIATGHYARADSEGGLYTAYDARKDQTYFLNRVPIVKLKQSIFPLGDFSKPEVRALAKYFKLPVADKPDSQGICFVGEVDMIKFLKSELGVRPGPIIDRDTGEKVGEHQGLWFYTVGQRKGIGIGGAGTPYYVQDLDNDSNTLFVVQGRQHKLLCPQEVRLEKPHFFNLKESEIKKLPVWVSLRYREKPRPATLLSDENGYFLRYKNNAWAPAGGQSAVFYEQSIPTKRYKPLTDPEQLFNEWHNEEASRYQQRRGKVLGGAVIA